MRPRVAVFGLLATLASVPALAQISVDEAYEKLKAREAQKQAASTQPVQTMPMIRVQEGMAVQDRAAAILAAQIAVSKASDDLVVAVAAADARAAKSPEYQRLLAQAAAAKDRATQSAGTREEQQAAARAADTAQQLCDVSRRALVKEDKDVLAKNKSLTLQQIKLWSLSATDLF